MHTGECVRQGCSQCHEGYCSNTWLDSENASEEVGELADDVSNKTNESKGNEEAWDTSLVVWWWNQCEENFPSNRQEVHHAVHGLNVLDLAVFALGWVEYAGCDELGGPGLLFLGIELGDKLGIGIGFLLLFQVGNNIDNLE